MVTIDNAIVAVTLESKGTSSAISTYTVPAGKNVLVSLIMVHTSNNARLRTVKLNGIEIGRPVTTADLRYVVARGLLLTAGDTITVQSDYANTDTYGYLFIRGFEI